MVSAHLGKCKGGYPPFAPFGPGPFREKGLAPPAEGRSDEDNINIYRQKATPDRIQNGPGYFYEKMELVQPHRRAMAMVKILQEVRSCSTLACSLAACILGSKPGNSQPKATPPGMSWT